MTRLVRGQLVAFVLIAVLGVVFVGARYIHVDHMLGIGQYHVRVKTAWTGNLTSGAEVTYRGVPVGRVAGMDLTADAVMIRLDLDSGKPKIPASAEAVVADRSAIGEQYLDLVPETTGGPYLRNGSVISGAQTPPPVQDLLSKVTTFANSTDLNALTTTVTELGKALDGQGENLQVLVQSLDGFSRSALDSLQQTIELVRQARTVLGTQADEDPAIRKFSTGLDQLASQLRTNDPDIRRLIGTGTQAGGAVTNLLHSTADPLTQDLTQLRQLLLAISPNYYALRPVLQMLPLLSVGGSATAPGDGTTHFGVVLETNNPPACTLGYEGTQRTLQQMKAANPDFDDTRDDFPLDTSVGCRAPQGSITGVRSGDRAELADPNVSQPWDGKPKTDPDRLNVTPLAQQLAPLVGVTPK